MPKMPRFFTWAFPHFYHDVGRLARRGRSTALRVVYLCALLIGLAIVFQNTSFQQHLRPNDFAQFSQRFTFTLFVVQNIAVMVLTQAYLGSAIAEEKERRTLEMLFTTQLSNAEIVLGKLFSRVIHLFGFVIAGLPILTFVQFWGGVDMVLIAGNLVNTLLNILSVGSICLLASALSRTVTGAVLTSYAVIVPFLSCCGVGFRWFPFVLQDARLAGGDTVTVQHLGILCLVHLVIVSGFLSLAIGALRDSDPIWFVMDANLTRLDAIEPWSMESKAPAEPGIRESLPVPTARREPRPPEIRPPEVRVIRRDEPENALSIPYTLPPVTDDALMWKECYVGGPPWFFSPVVLVPALPFVATGIFTLGYWFVRSLFLPGEEGRRALEGSAIMLRILYYGCLTAYVLGVGYRAAASVARERQLQTLEPLLLLPVERSEILRAKLFGCLWRGWPWLALLAGNVGLGTLIGVYHPISSAVLCIAPWAVIFFIAGLGLALSVSVQTVLRAHLFLLVMVMGFVAAAFVPPFRLNPLGYLEMLTLPFPPAGGNAPVHPEGGVIEPLASGAMWLAFFSVTAAVNLRIAFAVFDDRSHHVE